MTAATSPQVLRDVAATYVAAVREAAHAVAPDCKPSLFDRYRAVAARLVSAPEAGAHLGTLHLSGEPAEILAAMFLQKKLTAAMGAQDAILHASQRLWPVLALHDPVLVVWIAEALTYVRPVEVRAEPREAA
jgi:hypothetical protein